jgi:hypothetical protein
MVKLLSFWHAVSCWSVFLSGQIRLDNFMGATCSLPSSIIIHDKTDINHCLSQHNKLETLFFCAESIEHIQIMIRNFIMRTYHVLLVMPSPLSYQFQSTIIYMIWLYFTVGVHTLFFCWMEEAKSWVMHLTSWVCPMISWFCWMTDAIYLRDKSSTLYAPAALKILWIFIDRQP